MNIDYRNILKSEKRKTRPSVAVGTYFFCLGTIHKGRLLKGVGRGVYQKEIY
jgi:hypothetical protein